ncbi:hypothetical protein CRE_27366 [Caenorhabditis remanei]|uniref:DUF5641 domain-containing protein n=1 Tax=Caenorhabditis remanei TaxID=31234 RepID=E3LQ01_CAERE|nr:hypothetical protein CRE_27366 [Caenorhabditis remanei]
MSRKSSRGNSLTRMRHNSPPLQATSLLQRIVGPLKTSITKKCKTAGELIESSDHAIALFEDPHAEHITTHQQELVDAAEILDDLHKTSAVLQNLGEYIQIKFSDPEMQASPEKEEYMSDVKNHLVQVHVDDIIMLINHNADKLEIILANDDTSIENISPNLENSTLSDDRDNGEEHQSPDENSARGEDAVPTDHRDSNSSKSSTYHETSSDLPNQLPEPISNNESMLKQAETGNRRLQEEVQRLKLNNEKKLLAQMATERQRLELEKERLLRQETQMDLAEARSKKSSVMLVNNEHTARHSDPTAKSVQTQSSQNVAKNAKVQSATAPIAPTPTSQPNQSIKDKTITQANPSSQEMLLMNVMNKLSSIENTQNKTNNAIFAELAKSHAKMETLVDKKLEQRLQELIKDEEDSVNHSGETEEEKEFIREYENQGNTADEPSGKSKSKSDNRHRNHSRSRSSSRSHSRHRSHSSLLTDISLDTLVKHIKAFDGTGKLDIFEKTFANSVIKHPKLNDDMRYSILTTLVKGEAAPCIDQSTDSKLAIETTLNNLRNVYGKCNDKYNLLDRLKKLPFHQSSTKQMRLDIASHTVILGLLREKDMPENDEPAIYVIVGKLPPAMRWKIISYLSKMGPKVTQTQVLQRISQCIDNIELENTIMSQVTLTAANEVPTSYADINYAKATTSFPQKAIGQPLPNANKRPKSDAQLAYNPNAYSNQFYDATSKANLDGIYAPGYKGVDWNLLARSFPFTKDEVDRCPTYRQQQSAVFAQSATSSTTSTHANPSTDADTVVDCITWEGAQRKSTTEIPITTQKMLNRSSRFFVPREPRTLNNGISAGTGSKVPNSVPHADLPTALCNIYSQISTPIPLETALTAPTPLETAIVKTFTIILLTFSKTLNRQKWETPLMKEFAASKDPVYQAKVAWYLIIKEHYQDAEYLALKLPSSLSPYMDSDGLYRVNQQIASSVLPQKKNRPILIHHDHQSVLLLVLETLIYSCLALRGAYPRLVPDSKSEKYVLTLKIIYREVGVPSEINSDNAGTFKLDAAIINKDIDRFEYSQTLTCFLASKSITCRHITTLAVWQGDIYKRVVQLVRRQALKEYGPRVYDYHPLSYVISGAQGTIHKRPLSPFPHSPGDLTALRPFEIPNPGVTTEIPSDFDESTNPTGITEASVRGQMDRFEGNMEKAWKLWSIGYLNFSREAIHRKHRHSTLIPEVGQIVIVYINLLKRHKWPLGVVTKVNKSAGDGKIRSATVKCRDKFFERPVCQLIPLTITLLNHQYKKDMSEGITAIDTGSTKAEVTGPTEITYSKTASPTPDTLLSLDNRYAPELFPANVLPNIAERSAHHPAEKGTAADETEDHKQCNTTQTGTSTNPENLILEDIYSPEDGVYQDPQNTLPNIARDYGAENLPEGRSRDYHPRRAKATHINYVHTADIKILSRPSPPECCQLYHALHSFDNLKAL